MARALIAHAPGAVAAVAPILQVFSRAFLDDCCPTVKARRGWWCRATYQRTERTALPSPAADDDAAVHDV